jgi:gamma-glutamyltranspeptidase/glutathione hydrolase
MSFSKRSSIVFCLAASFIFAGFPLAITTHADTFRPVVRGKRGVVTGGQPLSVEAGLRILQQGGNAVDAGVATILAASVIEFSHFSFGGEVPILIKLKGQKVAVIEGMGQAPMNATRDFFVNRRNESDSGMMGARSGGLIPATGPLSATVPAVLDACVTALDQFGTKTLAEVMEPAIQLADGFPLDELRVQYIRTRSSIFSQWPDAKRVFLPNGEVPKAGDIFVQADLARTFREIVRAEKLGAKGTRNNRRAGLMAARDYFYRGPIARRIGAYMQQKGGLIVAEDFAKFSAKSANLFRRITAGTKSTRRASGRRVRQ